MRFLNGFILIGIMLLFISIAGAATGNRFLTEPGQHPNPYAWLEYLGAAALMMVNGIVSIRTARQNEEIRNAEKRSEQTNATSTDERSSSDND